MSAGVAALLLWIVTAGFGFFLFGTWLARGGVTQRSGDSRMTFSLPPPYFPAPLVFIHWLLAAAGLLVWVVYLVIDVDALAWIAFVSLLPVALIGFSMFSRWVGSRRARVVAMQAGVNRGPAESHLPSAVVFCHGLFGSTTLVLVLFVSMGVLHA